MVAAVVEVVWEVTEEVVAAAEDAKEIGLVLIRKFAFALVKSFFCFDSVNN